MSEPRQPETVPDEGEYPTQPIVAAKTEGVAWHPVDAVRPPAADPEANAAGAGPVVEQPVVDHSVVEQPVAADPMTAEPLAAEPVVAQPEPLLEAPAVEDPAVEEPAVEEPAVEASAPNEAVVAEPARHEESQVVADPASAASTGEPAAPLSLDADETEVVDIADERTVAIEPEREEITEPTSVLPTTVVPREATVAPPVPVPAPAPAAVPVPVPVPVSAPVPTESIFRQPSPTSSPEPEPTRMERLSDEEQKLAAERAARRDARSAALAATAPVALAAPEPVIVHKRTNDKFLGSMGLFLLRLVLAAIFAVRGLNLLTDIPAAQAMFAATIIPEPGIMAIVTGVAALLIALSLVLGLLTRLSGLGIALIAGGALAFVEWGNWSPFVAGRPGFLGDFELLMAAVGVLLLCIGGGGWSLDRSFRAGRERDLAERSQAAD